MALRIVKDGKVVKETPKTPLEVRLDELEVKITLLETYVKDISIQLKEIKEI